MINIFQNQIEYKCNDKRINTSVGYTYKIKKNHD